MNGPSLPSLIDSTEKLPNLHKKIEVISSSSDSGDEVDEQFEYYQKCSRESANFGAEFEKEKMNRFKSNKTRQGTRTIHKRRAHTQSIYPYKSKTLDHLIITGQKVVGESVSKVRTSKANYFSPARNVNTSLSVNCPALTPKRLAIHTQMQALENFKNRRPSIYKDLDNYSTIHTAQNLIKLDHERAAQVKGYNTPDVIKNTRNVDSIEKVEFTPAHVYSKTIASMDASGL